MMRSGPLPKRWGPLPHFGITPAAMVTAVARGHNISSVMLGNDGMKSWSYRLILAIVGALMLACGGAERTPIPTSNSTLAPTLTSIPVPVSSPVSPTPTPGGISQPEQSDNSSAASGVQDRGILKKCVNSQAVYPLSEQHGLKAQERR